MPKRPRSPNAVRRASFGRAERLRREAVDGRPAKPAPSRNQAAPQRRQAAPDKDRARGVDRAAAQQRKLTALDRVRDRIERADAKTERQRQQRLGEQTRAAFNENSERRRDTARRAEQERSRQHVEATRKRADDHRRVQARKTTERKRDQLRAAFNKEAARRRDAVRRIEHDRLRQRAAAEIEREQKRRIEDQKAEHRRQRDAVRTRRGIVRDGFRDNETAALERHHGRIAVINGREDRALAEFDGRRKGLAGRTAELIPGRRVENDAKRAEMVRGFEVERQAQHRDLERTKAIQHDQQQRDRIKHFQELKQMQGQHRGERAELVREQGEARPGLINDRARAIERADRAHEQQRKHERAERSRENIRPSGDFRAASDHAREPAAPPREFRQEGREMLRPTQAFGRA